MLLKGMFTPARKVNCRSVSFFVYLFGNQFVYLFGNQSGEIFGNQFRKIPQSLDNCLRPLLFDIHVHVRSHDSHATSQVRLRAAAGTRGHLYRVKQKIDLRLQCH